VTFRRSRRVACPECGIRHPAIYEGRQCLFCSALIWTTKTETRQTGTSDGPTETGQEYRAQILALQTERDQLRAVLGAVGAHLRAVRTREFHEYEVLAARGLAERDSHPIPRSVTTSAAFYQLMARAALDAVGLRSLLEHVATAEQTSRSAGPTGTGDPVPVADIPVHKRSVFAHKEGGNTKTGSSDRRTLRLLRPRLPRIVVKP
jgi:hypothetical protein